MRLSNFYPKQWLTLKIDTKARKHYEIEIEYMFVKGMMETSFKVAKNGNLYFNNVQIKSILMLEAALSSLCYSGSEHGEYTFEAIYAFLSSEDKDAAAKTLAKSLSKETAYRTMDRKYVEAVARYLIDDISSNTDFTENVVHNVEELLHEVDSISDLKKVVIVNSIQPSEEAEPLPNVYCDVRLS